MIKSYGRYEKDDIIFQSSEGWGYEQKWPKMKIWQRIQMKLKMQDRLGIKEKQLKVF